MGPIDVVIPLGHGSIYNNWELRYALRSLSANFPHRNVYIVGIKPKWIQNIIHIPFVDGGLKNYNLALKVLAACRLQELSDTFLYMHDDHFFTTPLQDIPDYYDGTIEEWQRKNINSEYKKAIYNTPPGLYYDNHTPKLMNKFNVVELLRERWLKDKLFKSTYFNAYPGNPIYLKDCKVHDRDIPGTPFFSTSRHIQPHLMRAIELKYPVPSKYEADD